MKIKVLFILLLANSLYAQDNFHRLELISLASKALTEKNYEEVIEINDEIIKSCYEDLLTEQSYSRKNTTIFLLARSHFQKAKAKAYLGRLKEGFYDLDAVEGAHPKNPIFRFYKTIYKTTFFDDDVDENIFFEKYGYSQKFLTNAIIKSLYDFGYYEETLSIYTSKLNKNKTPTNYYNVARLLVITGKKKKAAQYFNKALKSISEQSNSSSKFFNQLLTIRILQGLDKNELANNLLNELTLEHLDNVHLITIRAQNHYQNKEYEAAIGAYSKILIEAPYSSHAFIYLASSYIKLGATEKGLSILNELLAERPNYFYALSQRAKYYLDSNQFPLAKVDIEKALSLKPNHPLGFKLRGDLKLGLGQNKNACFDYKLAKEKYYLGVYPHNRQFLDNINLACPK